jgi:hypothetical protein
MRVTGVDAVHFRLLDVNACDGEARASEFDGQRTSDITEADHSDAGRARPDFLGQCFGHAKRL